MDNKDNNVFRISSNTNVLIYGGINYQEKDTSVATSIKKSEKDNEPYFVLNRSSKFKLNYLPGTLEEITNISKVLSTDNVKYQIVKGNDAKEWCEKLGLNKEFENGDAYSIINILHNKLKEDLPKEQITSNN